LTFFNFFYFFKKKKLVMFNFTILFVFLFLSNNKRYFIHGFYSIDYWLIFFKSINVLNYKVKKKKKLIIYPI